jgi:hypothetical protein
LWKEIKFNSIKKQDENALKKKEQYGGNMFRTQTIKIKRDLAGQSLKQLTWRNFT